MRKFILIIPLLFGAAYGQICYHPTVSAFGGGYSSEGITVQGSLLPFDENLGVTFGARFSPEAGHNGGIYYVAPLYRVMGDKTVSVSAALHVILKNWETSYICPGAKLNAILGNTLSLSVDSWVYPKQKRVGISFTIQYIFD